MNNRTATHFVSTGSPKLGRPGQPDHEVVVQTSAPPSLEVRLARAEAKLAKVGSILAQGLDPTETLQQIADALA